MFGPSIDSKALDSVPFQDAGDVHHMPFPPSPHVWQKLTAKNNIFHVSRNGEQCEKYLIMYNPALMLRSRRGSQMSEETSAKSICR